MDHSDSYHMSPTEFRRFGRMVVDWIADYYEQLETHPVLAQVEPGQVRAQLPALPPENGEPFEDILADINRIVLPGITHWQSPNFFAYFPANTSFPSILGELLSAGLGVQGMIWATSPACTEVETHVLDWMAKMLDLPERFMSHTQGGGVIQDSASSATLTALIAGRERATGWRSNEDGLTRQVTAYCSTQTHSSIDKAAMIAGIGRQNLRKIAVDENYAMRPEELASAIQADKAAGRLPSFVCATVGTTSSNAMDPLRAIGEICQDYGVWLHVDAAMAGTAALCPEFRWIHHGLELADSYAFNPHKWMFTNFDCDCFYVADRQALTRTMSILPEYLKNKASESGAVIDYRDWHIPLGRRFRSLKLWFVIRHYGVVGLRHHVRRHVALAQQFAAWVQAHPDFELAAPAPLNLVCFRHKAGDELNRLLMERLNASGKLFLTHTALDSQYTLRMSIGSTYTEEGHVRTAWERIKATALELISTPPS